MDTESTQPDNLYLNIYFELGKWSWGGDYIYIYF